MATSAPELAEWLAAARAGSTEALGKLLEHYRGYLLRIAQGELAPDLQAKGGASDLVQETFLEAQQALAQFHGTGDEELRAWLRQLLRHNLADFSRGFRATGKRQVGREASLPAGEASGDPAGQLAADQSTPSARAIRGEQAQALAAALQRLPDEYRQVIGLRHQEGLTFEAIGQRLSKTENAVRKLWARAVERVQAELGEPP